MMEYVIIGFGCKHTFTAETKYKALEKARLFAHDLQLTAWLLYNRAGDLLYNYPNDDIIRLGSPAPCRVGSRTVRSSE